MNKKNKTIVVILISIILLISNTLYSNAKTIENIIDDGNSFLTVEDNSVVMRPNESDLQDISKTVSGVLLTIAMAVTFISIAVMGFNFAVQSVEDKAKIKESMVPWIIGIFVSFGAYGIWKMTMNIFYKF